jgi:hypothetical protein
VTETTTQHPRKPERRLRPLIRRLLGTWLARRKCLPIGWLGSFLTCLGGALTTSAWSALSGGVAPASFMSRVGVSYVGAATVVTLLFPLLPTGVGAIAKTLRRKRGGDTACFPVRR